MNGDPQPLLIAPCDHAAAKYAVLSWHYSRRMPSGKLVKFGVWEHGRFVGCVLYGRGATAYLGRPYGLGPTEICELVRVALDTHQTPVSQIVAETLRQLKQLYPGLRLVVSFADSYHGHHGGIYQAGNWLYLGHTGDQKTFVLVVNGKRTHPRNLGITYGPGGQSIPWLRANVDPQARRVYLPPKHRYVYPLDKQMRRRLTKLAQPYPPPADEGSTVSRPAHQPGGAGSTPAVRSTTAGHGSMVP